MKRLKVLIDMDRLANILNDQNISMEDFLDALKFPDNWVLNRKREHTVFLSMVADISRFLKCSPFSILSDIDKQKVLEQRPLFLHIYNTVKNIGVNQKKQAYQKLELELGHSGVRLFFTELSPFFLQVDGSIIDETKATTTNGQICLCRICGKQIMNLKYLPVCSKECKTQFVYLKKTIQKILGSRTPRNLQPYLLSIFDNTERMRYYATQYEQYKRDIDERHRLRAELAKECGLRYWKSKSRVVGLLTK